MAAPPAARRLPPPLRPRPVDRCPGEPEPTVAGRGPVSNSGGFAEALLRFDRPVSCLLSRCEGRDPPERAVSRWRGGLLLLSGIVGPEFAGAPESRR